MFIELSSKPITAAEKIKHRFSFTDRSHQNQRTDATKTFKSPFKAVKVIRKGRERQTVNGTKCIRRFKVAFTTRFSKLWPESIIAKAKDCTESVQVYKPHRPPELFRIKVSFRNSASNILAELPRAELHTHRKWEIHQAKKIWWSPASVRTSVRT